MSPPAKLGSLLTSAVTPRLAVICDLLEENWPSMDSRGGDGRGYPTEVRGVRRPSEPYPSHHGSEIHPSATVQEREACPQCRQAPESILGLSSAVGRHTRANTICFTSSITATHIWSMRCRPTVRSSRATTSTRFGVWLNPTGRDVDCLTRRWPRGSSAACGMAAHCDVHQCRDPR